MYVNVAEFGLCEPMSQPEREAIQVGTAVAGLIWSAGADSGRLTLADVQTRGRCIALNSALQDAFHLFGYPEATLVRCGATRALVTPEGRTDFVTVGHPASSRHTQLWPGHLVVQLGSLLFDASYPQFQMIGEEVIHCAIFNRQSRFPAYLHHHGQVDGIACASWRTPMGDNRFLLFELPRRLERATRNWRARPDARPELRRVLLNRVLAIAAKRSAEDLDSRNQNVDLRVEGRSL